jgi:hypothetical protein
MKIQFVLFKKRFIFEVRAYHPNKTRSARLSKFVRQEMPEIVLEQQIEEIKEQKHEQGA